MTKYTDEDVKYLADCITDSKQPGSKPFAFLLGAGVSLSAGIPLARDLVKKINDEPRLNKHLKGMTDRDRVSYPKCMARLSTEDRRTLLRPYLSSAKINWASLVLATLLKPTERNGEDGHIKRLLTFNFDDVLARACGICGHYPATYDFSVNPPSDFQFMNDGSIAHLHGQGSGLIMLNSEKDTKNHARKLGALFTDTLANYDLVVIGYSGEADSTFTQFKQKFEGRTRLFWVGYEDSPALHIQQLIKKAPETSNYFGGADADAFLLKLAEHFSCWPPQVLTAPEAHLLSELKPIIAYPGSPSGDNLLANIRANLKKASEKRRDEAGIFDRLLLQKKYDEIVSRVKSAKSDKQKSAVAWAYIMQGNKLVEAAKLKREDALFRESFVKFQEALRMSQNTHEAFNSWGNALTNFAILKSEEALYHEAFAKYEKALEIKPDYFRPLYNLGFALMSYARLKKDETYYQQSIAKFNAALLANPEMFEAQCQWGVALADLAILKKDVTLFHESFKHFEAALKIKPDSSRVLDSWSAALLHAFDFTSDRELAKKAADLCTKAETLSGKPSYNLACAFARLEREDMCREQLLRCQESKTLPEAKHLENDKDLMAYHEKEWFKNLLKSDHQNDIERVTAEISET